MNFYAFLGILLLPGVAEAKELSLGTFLNQVEETNPLLAASEKRAAAAEKRIRPAGAWQDPFFAFGVDEIPFSGSDTTSVYRFQISQTVPFPGKAGAKKKAATERAHEAQGSQEALARETRILAIQSFYRALYNQEALQLNTKLAQLVRSTVESLKARYRTGSDAHHEWLLARAEMSILEVERIRLERDQELFNGKLNELRNLPPDAPVGKLLASFSPEGKKAEPAIEAQPELKVMHALEEAAAAEVTAAKLSYFPDFVMQGMLMEPRAMAPMGSMGGSSWGVMVGINLPVFFFAKQSRQLSAARFEQEAARLERQSLENRLLSEVSDAKRQLKTSDDVVRLYKESVIPATELAAKNVRSGYAARRLPLSELLSTLKVQRTQELELLAAKIDRELAVARLENLLSAPPMQRFAPGRPSLFMGPGTMPASMSGMNMPEAIEMGRGMKKPAPAAPEGGGMGGMEGM